MIEGFLTTRGARRGTALALAAVLAAGCVGANATGSAAVTPTSAPTTVPSESALTSTSTNTNSTIAPTLAGTWRSIEWTALPVTDAIGANPAPGASALPDGASFQVFGWSRGFVGFTIIPNQPTDAEASAGTFPVPTVLSSYSADGVHWRTGQNLDPTAAGSRALQAFRTVLEGHDGLLAVGWSGACGSEFLDGLWTSTDGIAWQPVNVQKAFGVDPWSIPHVSGGGAGFVAVAYKSAGAWTSTDGRTWTRIALGAGPFADARVDDGTAIAGGYVLSGTVGTRDCGVTTYESPTPLPPLRTATAWWSADGATWMREALPGAVASREDQYIWTAGLDDHAAILVDTIVGVGTFGWGTSDGRTWTAAAIPSDIDEQYVVAAGGHNLVFGPFNDFTAVAQLRIRTIDDHFAVLSVSQGGEVPSLAYQLPDSFAYGLVAVGPTGVVVSSGDGTRLWFGSPSTN
jgi:hypothetical protein